MWFVGVGLALVPFIYGLRCWLTGHAIYIFTRGKSLDLTGPAAVAMAIAYMGIGVFMHAHWFWALHPKLAIFSPLLKGLALLVFIGGLGFTGYYILAA